MTTIRPGTLDDAAAYVTLRNTIFPYQVNTVDGIRHFWRQSLAEEAVRLGLFAAEVDGRLVGFGRCGLNTWTSEAGAANIVLVVEAAHRGAGIGARLLGEMEVHLRAAGALNVTAWSADDPASLAFAAGHGYATSQEMRYSAVRVADLPPMPDLPAGVSVATAAELGPEAVFAVDSVTTQDEPGDTTIDVIEYGTWLAHVWEAPEFSADASVCVLVDGSPAAYTCVEADLATGRAWSGGTGTLREHRGQGLAKIAKSAALRRAAELGITMAYTSNDETNAPMLAVNEWLGYRPVATQWSQRKAL